LLLDDSKQSEYNGFEKLAQEIWRYAFEETDYLSDEYVEQLDQKHPEITNLW
jgi:hypothetical protein